MDLRSLAEVVCNEMGLIMSPEERHARYCALEPWWELLTDVLIIKRCAAKVGIDMATFLTHLIEDMRPPNWELFFWMRACFQSVSVEYHNRMLKQFGDTARTVAWERAQKEVDTRLEEMEDSRREFLVKTGAKGGESRSKRYAELKAWALNSAKDMKGSDKDIASKLCGKVPKHLKNVSTDPERMIYETLLAQNKARNKPS